MRLIFNVTAFYILVYLNSIYTSAQPIHSRFDHFTTKDGLSGNQITHIIQDNKGFLWISTKTGLNKFDGQSFNHYKFIPDENNSLSDNEVNFIYQSSDELIWIGTQDGLNLLNPYKEEIKRFHLNDSLPSKEITAIGEDKFGNLWVGTRKGVVSINKNNSKLKIFSFNPANKRGITGNSIKAIQTDINGNLWIGTTKGLCRFNYDNEEFESFLSDSTNPKSISGNMISYLRKDKTGNLWIGTATGLSKLVFVSNEYEFENYTFDDATENGKKLNRIRSFDFDSKGNLWIGTIGGGLIKFNPSTGQFINFQYSMNDLSSINDNEIFAVCVDNFDNVWVGSPQKGLSKFSPSKARFELFKPDNFSIKDVPSNDITTIFPDESNLIWLGTNGDGIFVYRLNENYYPSELIFKLQKKDKGGLASNYITSIIKDKEGFYWIGTLAGGLNRYDSQTKMIEVFKTNPDDPTSISNNYINTIFEDSEGYIWVGTSAGGVNRYDKQTNSFTRFVYLPGKANNNSINSPEITSITEDNDGNLLFGTTTGGLNLYDKKEKRFVYFLPESGNKNSLSFRNISCIYKDKVGRLWIGTLGGGLNLYQDNLFRHLTEQNGFVSNIILSITEDKNGFLWLTTSTGVSLFNPQTNELFNFDEGDGLQTKEFNPGALANHKLSGTLFFGGAKGLNIYNNIPINKNLNSPQIVFTDFKVFNKSVLPSADAPLKESISYAKEIILSHDQNVISFSFASLDFTSPSKNQYAYLLEGFDNDWVYIGNNREVTYTNLSPGNYLFKVKATNSDGVWSENAAQIMLTIKPPIWQTWWAFILYTIIAFLGLYGIRKYELSRIKLRNELRLKEFESKKLQEVDLIKSRFFANISHEFRTPLMLIKGPVEHLINHSKDDNQLEQLQIVNKNADKLKQLIEQILELSQLEAATIPLKVKEENLVPLLKGITYSFESHARQKNISLGFISEDENIYAEVDRDKLEKIINNLLSNAFKFTDEGGKVFVEIQRISSNEKLFAEIKISDTGIGIEQNKLEKIFDRFYQVDDTQSKKYAGSGIGLALVKELVDLHKWNISVKSRVGEGTSFILRIPLINKFNAENIPAEVKVISNEISEQSFNDYSQDVEKFQNQSDKPTILIVEDSEDVRKYISEVLKKDFNLIEASDGKEGIEKAKSISPDLIISDVMMPVIDGIEFCRIIKTDFDTSHIPIILLTAKVSHESKLEGLETGADDYLQKPFETRELFIRIRNLLRQRKRLKEKYSKEIRIAAETVTSNTLDNEFLNEAFEVANKNYSNPDFNAEDLAIELNMSLSKFRRKLLALTGESPGEFLRTYRLKKSAQMIIENKFSITQIALEVGFSSSSHFTKAFQQHFGCLPSEFNQKLS